jgi:serine/threonine-protein kinase
VWLLRRRGVGGFEKYFALKRIRPEFVGRGVHIAMFLDEARLAALLHHPGIVQVLDVGEDEGGFWYVMEYVHGRSASHVLGRAAARARPLPIECAAYIGRQMARALHYAHHLATAQGPLRVVHRDVSPGNILLGFDGSVKLADFGVARAAGRLAETSGATFKGKYAYASPEQIRGEELDGRSDLYSLGLVLHELITGARVFGDPRLSPLAVLQAALHAPIDPPSRLRSTCPPALDHVVLRAVQRTLSERYATGIELASALDDAIGTASDEASAARLAAYLVEIYGDEARAAAPMDLASAHGVPADGFIDSADFGTTPVGHDRAPAAAHVSGRGSGREPAAPAAPAAPGVPAAIDHPPPPVAIGERGTEMLVMTSQLPVVDPAIAPVPPSVVGRRGRRLPAWIVAGALALALAVVAIGATLFRDDDVPGGQPPAVVAPPVLPTGSIDAAHQGLREVDATRDAPSDDVGRSRTRANDGSDRKERPSRRRPAPDRPTAPDLGASRF